MALPEHKDRRFVTLTKEEWKRVDLILKENQVTTSKLFHFLLKEQKIID